MKYTCKKASVCKFAWIGRSRGPKRMKVEGEVRELGSLRKEQEEEKESKGKECIR